MTLKLRSIAVLAANPAFASILSRTLEDGGMHRVPVFETLPALSTFLRIAPVDLAILSLDAPWSELVHIVRGLKAAPHNANPLLEVIVLTHAPPLVQAPARTGIAAVLSKPVAPAELMAAVEDVLAGKVPARRPPVRHVPAARKPHTLATTPQAGTDGNVISLFGFRPTV